MNLAEKGYFNKQGLTPIESVDKTNVHDVLFLLNLQSAISKENEQS